MKYLNNMEAVSKLQPDYMGFIFYDKSSRYFQGEIPSLPETIKKVGVFVDESFENILAKTNEFRLDLIQLHGHESVEYVKSLLRILVDSANKMPELIKVFSIKDEFDFSQLKPYKDYVSYFLFDTKGKLPGGNGYTFNWGVLNDYPFSTPYFLSGGIGLNETEKIKTFKESPASKYCYSLDVNSKFEINPGVKNISELEKFKYELQH